MTAGNRPITTSSKPAAITLVSWLCRERSSLSRFLAWWKSKLEYDCRVALADNLFVDQRWLDLSPGLFGNVSILRHEGYNVAYWNLAHRTIRRTGDGYRVNAVPLAFFHFSGLNVTAPGGLSIHQDRFSLRNLGAAADLVRDYCRVNLQNGFRTCRSWNQESLGTPSYAGGKQHCKVAIVYKSSLPLPAHFWLRPHRRPDKRAETNSPDRLSSGALDATDS